MNAIEREIAKLAAMGITVSTDAHASEDSIAGRIQAAAESQGIASNRCIHCGQPLAGADYPTHTAGGYRHKQRCDPDDTGQPYGLAAHRPGTPCHELCSGSAS